MRSPRHRPAARTSTSRSLGPRPGSGHSRQATWPASMTTALMARSWRQQSAAGVDGHVVALVVAQVELAGTGDLLVLLEQLDPVGQPARGAGDGEEHREHLDGEA